MAGIGFVLRKLMKKEDLSSILRAYFHAILASSGAWLFTVLALGSFFFVFKNWHHTEEVENFRAIILYNFSFSLVLSSPIVLISTRYLADCIYEKKLSDTTGLLLGSLVTLVSLSFLFAAGFYFLFTNLSFIAKLLAIANFLIVSMIWLLMVFISASTRYKTVTFSFLAGLAIAIISSVYFGFYYEISGMLLGFNLGLGATISSLLASILSQYPKASLNYFSFLHNIKKYRDLWLGGLFYNLAIWIDKWIMWLSPESERLSIGLSIAPYYDTATFTAYLTIVPGLATFLLTQETAFFEVYSKFYQDIQKHASLKKIHLNHQELIDSVLFSGRNILLLQLSICLVVLLLTPQIFNLLGMSFIMLGIFRFAVLGATFQVFIIFLGVLLSYFDYRRGTLKINLCFFFTNLIFTLATVWMGFSFYGYGFFLSCLVTFTFAALITEHYLRRLPYHAFITSNPSVRDI